MLEHTKHYYIGLPEWRHPDWYIEGKNPKNPLSIYAKHLSSVEGNTTFYALPSRETVKNWATSVSEEFRFCFKFPKSITHDAKLAHCSRAVGEFIERLSPIHNNLGILWLQMSSAFTPEYIPALIAFLDQLPNDFNYGIEVRNPGFFQKDDIEKQFNRALLERGVNRVMFDTRILFANPASDDATQKSLVEKPRLPLHVVATGKNPMLRFMSPMNMELSESALDQWVIKTIQWIDEGKVPYLFFHMPYKGPAPILLERFSKKISTLRLDISPITLWQKPPEQSSLF